MVLAMSYYNDFTGTQVMVGLVIAMVLAGLGGWVAGILLPGFVSLLVAIAWGWYCGWTLSRKITELIYG